MRDRERRLLTSLGYVLAATWVFGVSLFYFIRVSSQIHAEHGAAIEALAARIFGTGG
jgi:hypothetical protein